jgi:RNA polymerase sigma-70 factor, ECF subfamily
MTNRESDFTMFFRAQYPGVARVAYLMTGDRAAAEDVAQEAFVRLFARWRRVAGYDRPEAWVRTVAVRLAQRTAKRRRVEGSQVIDTTAVSPVRRDHDLWTAVSSLPRAQRAAVVLHYYEDLPVDEVAAILGCSGPTARVHLHKARRKLGAILGEETADV